MSNSDFGSVFGNTQPDQDSDEDFISIDLGDLDQPQQQAIQPIDSIQVDVLSPQEVAEQRYGINLPGPKRNEDIFVGVARNPEQRPGEEEYWPIFANEPRKRQTQTFTFEVEISDQDGNPVDHVPVEVRGLEISGVLPSDGTPVAVYGLRDKRDGVVRTYDVINIRNKSSLRVMVRKKDWCFIATAVYGSLDVPQVILLRQFRDRRLMSTFWGRWLIDVYYRYSPPVARWVAAKRWRRQTGKFILDNLVKAIRHTVYS